MVSYINSIKATPSISYKNTDEVKTLLKYVNNESLKDVPDTFSSTTKSAIGSAALFEGIPLFNFIRRNALLKKNGKTVAKDAMNKLGEVNKEALKNLFSKEGKFGKKLLSFVQTSKDTIGAYREVRGAVKAEAKAIKKAGSKKAVEFAEAATTKTKAAQEAVKKVTTKTAAEAGAKTVSKLGKLGNLLRSTGAGFMLVFSGIIEGISEVIPTFKELGFAKGVKQLGKSAVKVVGDTIGFIGGEYGGTALGTAIGTAICPGIGTAVGAVCGFLGGMLGSFVMGKVTRAITGKSEREKAKEQELNQQAQQIFNNSASIEELKNQAKAKMAQEVQMGGLSEDSQIASEALKNLENPFYQGCVA